jgi:hypothetical protein
MNPSLGVAARTVRCTLQPMQNLTVECPCGSTKLEISADPITAFYCHCDDDQAIHAAPMVGVTLFPEDGVKPSGEAVTWQLRATPRTSCGRCGTRMMINPGGAPVVGVAATLLPDTLFDPKWHQQCDFSKVQPAGDLPCYKGLPTAMGGPNDDLMNW